MLSILTLTTKIWSLLDLGMMVDSQLARYAIFRRDMRISEESLREELVFRVLVKIPQKSDENFRRHLGMAILQFPWKAWPSESHILRVHRAHYLLVTVPICLV